MDFDRDWTEFSLEAEVGMYGTRRLASAHNVLCREVEGVRQRIADMEAETERLQAERDMLAAAIDWPQAMDTIRWNPDGFWCCPMNAEMTGPYKMKSEAVLAYMRNKKGKNDERTD